MEATENIVTHIADLIRDGEIDQAIKSASEFADSGSKDHRAYFTIARLVGGVADPDLTERCLSRSTELLLKEPRYPLALASFLVAQNRHADAIKYLDDSLQVWPDNADAHFSIADCYARTGNPDAARAHLQKAIESNESHGQAHYLLVQLNKYANRDNPHVVNMKVLSERSDIDNADRMWIMFALGRALESIGEYARAFSYFKKASALRRPDNAVDEAAQRDRIQDRIERFDGGFFKARAGHGCDSEGAVFVIGMPGTGATIIEQVIASHPMAASSGSRLTLPRTLSEELAEFIPAGAHMPNLESVPSDRWAGIGQRYVDILKRRAPGAERMVDARLANFRLIGEAHLILPKARFIHCVRDARDSIMSCYSTPFAVDSGLNFDLSVISDAWRNHKLLMDHWKEMLPTHILEIRYEDMVSNPEDTARKIIEFIGLTWDEACLAMDGSRMQVRAPLHTGAIERWKRFENKMQDITDL